ncbi:MAG TPA: POTRA domain-containing protein [Candidatus Solibacter sp.]|jgi:outer membrane protein assembly factor BamA|nr:POTRA domain-containing protein [Candidatus Solibacter sp.]
MRNCRLLFFFFLLISTACEAAPEQYHLIRVLVRGSKRYAPADLIRATGLVADSRVTIADLQNAANRMVGYGAFSLVKYLYKPAIGTDGIEADFEVKDEEQVLPAVFDNFLWFSPDQLKAAVHGDVPLFDGLIPTTGSLLSSVVNSLQKLLAAKGVPSEVSYALQQDIGKPAKAYLFRVENAGLKIKEFNFSGANQMDASLLKQAVARLKARDYFYSDLADSLKNAVIPVYRQRGFLSAELSEINPRLAEGGVDVDVHVSEGSQYRLGGFQWSGNTLIAADELSRHISLKPGELVNGLKLDHDLGAVQELFGRFGRQGATVTPIPTYAAGTVNYNFQVREGDIYRMGKLEIAGANPQHKTVILSLWKLAEGEAYDSTYVWRHKYQCGSAFKGQILRWQVEEQADPENKVVNVRLNIQLSDRK